MRVCIYVHSSFKEEFSEHEVHKKKNIHNNVCRNHIVDNNLVLSNLLQLLPLWYREPLYCPLQLMREEPGTTSSKGYFTHKKKPKTQKKHANKTRALMSE
jgi:hypothetical protein